MDIKEINDLKLSKNTNLYDLTKSVFTMRLDISFYPHFVEKNEEMRMDKISEKLYNTNEHVGFLLKLNNIINPLNIKEGMLLIYVNEADIDSFTPIDDTFINEVKQTLLNLSKRKRVDSNREKYLKESENNIKLPPVFNNDNNDNNISIDNDGVITIGPV